MKYKLPLRKVREMGHVQGGRQRSPHLTSGKMTPYLRVANVFDGHIDLSDVLEMPFTDVEFQQYKLKPGDLLLNEGQSLELVGRCAKYQGEAEKYCFQNTLVRFHPGAGCDTEYAHQLFRWCQQSGVFAEIATRTNSIAHLGSTRFAELELPFPPLPEQRQIATILSQWDDSLSILSRLIDAKRQQKRGLAEQLLTGKRRLPGFEGEWEETTLGSVFYLLIGGTPSRNNASLWDTENLSDNVWLSISDLKGKYVGNSRERITDEGVRKSNVKRIPARTVVMSFKLTLGRAAITTRSLYTNEAICGFIPKGEDTVDTEYFYQAVTLMNFAAGVDQAVKGVTLNKEKLQNFYFYLPPLPEQRAIASVLSTLDEETSALERLRASVQAQKRGLMDLLLTGRVRVKVGSRQ